ncbi:DUF6538 domain-containing protein [Marinobacter alexandrii]|uniref:DUF6538 domain-containing protein n=1 Tax=Marinobacter alexandrii TaxID=2570351 RepID=UPI003263B6D5
MTVIRVRSSLHRRLETSNLQYRKGIPEKLRPYFNGKWEIKETLNTPHPTIARVRHHELSAKVEAQIANAWAQFHGQLKIEETQLHHMADRWYQSKLDNLRKPEVYEQSVAETVIHRGNGRAPVLDREHTWSLTLQTPPQANTFNNLKAALGKEAEELLLQSEIALRQDSELYHKLLVLMADRALRVAGEATKNHDCGVSSSENANRVESRDSPKLSEVWTSFEQHYASSENPKDKAKVATYRSDFSKFIQHTGDVRLSMLNRSHALGFRDVLRALPDTTVAGFRELAGFTAKDFRNLPLDQQCEIASEENLTARSAPGVRNALKRTAAVLAWADREQWTKYNVLNPLPDVPNAQSEKQGEAFQYDSEEARTLLTSDHILGSLSVDELWCMLVLYYTGARLREITPMMGEDLLIVDGPETEGLQVREEHELGRRVKNKASIRVIPVHKDLKELGFLEYADRQPRDPLFPDLWDMTGNRAGSFSKKLKFLGMKEGIRPTVRPSHGFRHHVIGLWREAEKRQDLQDAYLGHAAGSQQAKYSGFKAVAKAAQDVWPELPDKQKLMAYLWPTIEGTTEETT